MKFIIVISKGVIKLKLEVLQKWLPKQKTEKSVAADKQVNVFSAIVRKEFTDYITSWRIIILLAIILLTCVGSLYTAVTTIQDALDGADDAKSIGRGAYLFLKLFITSDGSLPSFIIFVGFLGPLLGIALGFDAINSERNKGTLSRLMAQPIPRDYVISGKFVAALLINILLFFTLGFLVMALGILIFGIPPTLEEVLRILSFLILCIVYIGFWLSLGILFSVCFKQAATSALSGIAIWLFFSLFYQMIVDMISKSILNPEKIDSMESLFDRQNLVLNISRLSPEYLFTESTTTLLSPTVRSLGPLSMEQMVGAVASPLPFTQSLLLIWPQVTGLIAATLICFAIGYILFMRQEIRTNS